MISINTQKLKEIKLNELDMEYKPLFNEIKIAFASAQLDGNATLVTELQTEYQSLKQEYQTKREEIING